MNEPTPSPKPAPTPDDLRDALFACMDEHRRKCPLTAMGRPCREHVALIAWLAHCAGVRAANIGELHRHIEDYELHCPDCQHLRN